MGIILLLIGVFATTSNHMVQEGSKAPTIKEIEPENEPGVPESSATSKYQSDSKEHDAMSASSPILLECSPSSMESEACEPRLGKVFENDITSNIRSCRMKSKTNLSKQITDSDYTQQPEVSTAENPSLSTSNSFSKSDSLSLSEDSDDDKTVLFHVLLDQSMHLAQFKYKQNLPYCTFCLNHFGKNRITFLVEGEFTKEEEEEFNAFRRVLRPELKEENSEVEDPNASAKDNESQFMSVKDNKNEENPSIADDLELDTLSKNSDETESVMEEVLDIHKTLITIQRNFEDLERISFYESKRIFQLCSHEITIWILCLTWDEKLLSGFCELELGQYIRRARRSSKRMVELKNILSEILQYNTLHLETVKKARDVHNEFEKLKASFLRRMKLLSTPYEGDEPDVVCIARQLHLFKIAILVQWSSWQNFLVKEERDRILSDLTYFASYIYSLLNVYTAAFLGKTSDKENNSIFYYNRIERAYWALSGLINDFFIMAKLNLRLIEDEGNLMMLLKKIRDCRYNEFSS